MNKILIETSAGELIDKITILEIKKEKISEQKSLEIINKEFASLRNSMEKNLNIPTKTVAIIQSPANEA